jgi:predicted nucleic acid-binding protein
MSSSSFLINPSAGLIADASVVINLNATARAADIIRAVAYPFFVTENALEELKSGSHKGHRDHSQLLELIDAGLVRRATLGVQGLPVYESMIDGSTLRTLDDGEAATIAFAQEIAGTALIDERKARTLCKTSFPHLDIASTVELLMHDTIASAIGAQGQINALMDALTKARMRVPAEHIEQLTRVIGAERAASCSSLPRHIRETGHG